MFSFDITLQNYISSIRTLWLTEYLFLVTIFFDTSLRFLVLVVCISLLIYLVRGFKYAKIFIFSLILGGLLSLLLKFLFGVARPTEGVLNVVGPSFPSYHATESTIFFLILIYIFDDYLSGISKIIFNSFCVFFILLVSFSRVYLGVHWLSDVLFGIFLGILVSKGVILFFNKKNSAL